MNSLLKHNLIAGWRNIMKYKVQNTVSVLCLAVGAVLFGITLYWANVKWESEIKYHFPCSTVDFSVLKGNQYTELNYEQFDTLRHLPVVKSICYKQQTAYKFYYGKKYIYMGDQAAYVSPDWFEKNNFYSETTGRKIGILKPGTIIATNAWYRSIVIHDSKTGIDHGAPAIGELVSFGSPNDTVKGKISDVAYSTTYQTGLLPDVVIVTQHSDDIMSSDSTFYASWPYIENVTLNDGYNAELLKAQFEKAMPDYKMELVGKRDQFHVVIFLFIIILGASVLIIGMSGYLKMQLQLFCLRSREMALRRCNGAKPIQLFMLLCSELLIVFVFTAIVAAIIYYALFAYVTQNPYNDLFAGTIYFHQPTILRTIIWVVVASFLASVGIAWITVRKLLRNPLSTTISSTFSQHTVWNKSMQVIQYLMATILLAIVGLALLSEAYHIHFSDAAGDIRNLKRFIFSGILLATLAMVSLISIILTVYSSVSLETRGRQKEVAIRKVNGAKTRDIIMLFSRYYIVTLATSYGIVFALSLIIGVLCKDGEEFLRYIVGAGVPILISMFIITIVTILTLWQKIYKIAHINPALLIKKE